MTAQARGELTGRSAVLPIPIAYSLHRSGDPNRGLDRAEVAEWQTRRIQNSLGFTARVGSSPTFGNLGFLGTGRR